MEKGYLLINSYPLYILGVLLDLEDSWASGLPDPLFFILFHTVRYQDVRKIKLFQMVSFFSFLRMFPPNPLSQKKKFPMKLLLLLFVFIFKPWKPCKHSSGGFFFFKIYKVKFFVLCCRKGNI
jgi:hypothetical protein